MTRAQGRVRVGSARDSWGAWFLDEPQRVPWERFLDEAFEAGHSRIELGPYGCLPTDPARLTEEAERHGPKVSAGTVSTAPHHRGPDVGSSAPATPEKGTSP